MNHFRTLALLLLLYSIPHLPQSSTAASSPTKAGDADITTPDPLLQTSPTPGPVPGNGELTSGDGKVEVKPPAVSETCEASNVCHDDVVNVTACVFPYAGDASMRLLVLNEGDASLKFNVTIIPSETTYDNIEIPGHEIRKINVSASVSSTSSVVLNAEHWTCRIHLEVPVPLGFLSYSYAAYVTPVNGAYVLFATALFIGLVWACCKLGKNRRHSDGVPYQELEMGQHDQSTSSIDVETAAGWDQDWDDDWAEEKAMRSPDGNHIGNRRANGGSSRFAESNGWGDDWKD